MKYEEIKNLSVSELQNRLSKTRQALLSARIKHKMKRLSNMMELRKFKKDIARLSLAISLKEPEPVSVKKTAHLSDSKTPAYSVNKKTVKKTVTNKKTVTQKAKLKVEKKKVEKKIKKEGSQLALKSDLSLKKLEKKSEKKIDQQPAEKKSKNWLGRLFGKKK